MVVGRNVFLKALVNAVSYLFQKIFFTFSFLCRTSILRITYVFRYYVFVELLGQTAYLLICPSNQFLCFSPSRQESGSLLAPSLQPSKAPATAPLVSASPACKRNRSAWRTKCYVLVKRGHSLSQYNKLEFLQLNLSHFDHLHVYSPQMRRPLWPPESHFASGTKIQHLNICMCILFYQLHPAEDHLMTWQTCVVSIHLPREREW